MYRTALVLLAVSACTSEPANQPTASPTPTAQPTAPSSARGKEITTESGLKYTVLKQGLDEKPMRGQKVSVHYTGRFTDGRVFDSSVLESRPPLVVPVGIGKVIKGWDEALLDMGLGEKRRLSIPPHLAYGSKGFGNLIAPNTTLIFEVELVGLLERPRGQPSPPARAPAAVKTNASQDPSR